MPIWHLASRFPKGRNSSVTRLLLLILLGLVVIVALVFGVVILAILLLAAACFFAVLYLRGRWLSHRLGLNLKPEHKHTRPQSQTIEGGYTVHSSDSYVDKDRS